MRETLKLFMCAVILSTSPARGADVPHIRRYELLRYTPLPPPLLPPPPLPPDDEVPSAHWRQGGGRGERAFTHATRLNFTALGRQFALLLTPDLETLHPQLKLQAPGVPAPPPTLYRGTVAGEAGSRVYGSLLGGVFQGTIEIPPLAYYVEPSQVVMRGADTPPGAHSVIYASNDVQLPAGVGCGYKDGEDVTTHGHHHPDHDGAEDELWDQDLLEDMEPVEDVHSMAEARRRRYVLGGTGTPPKLNPNQRQAGVCTMSVETDPKLWQYALEMFSGDVKQARDYLISLIGTHMVYVNHLYAVESFSGQYQHEGLQFQLQKLLITDTSSCDAGHVGEESRFCGENVDYRDFLMLQSRGDHSEFCLAFAFTYRDFTESVMGFAWKANRLVKDKYSGVCGVPGLKLVDEGGKLVKIRLSKNCGIVSLLNFGKRVTLITSHITFAHEIGHTLGSPHDKLENKARPECVPAGFGGMYIMYPYSVSGYDPNNSRFSPCSKGNISIVLDIIANGRRRRCFVASTGSYCGNRVREPGEQCDCGFSAEVCEDKCCYPRKLTEHDHSENGSATGCSRRHNTQCSPSEGPCCHAKTCQLVKASERRVCHAGDECVRTATCNGTTAACPPAAHKPNHTDCQAGAKVCVNGLCQASACIKEGLQECILTDEDVVYPLELCMVACNVPGYTGCRVMTPGPIQLPAGASCNNASGYCDVFGRCRPYRNDGPLARVRRLLFTGEGRRDLLTWLKYKWWAAILIVVCLILLLVVVVRCFAVHTPSSNPQLAPPRHIKETIHHPVDALGLPDLDQIRHCWPGSRVRTSIPSALATTPTGAGGGDASVPNDDAQWSETSSFEHLNQLDPPAVSPRGSRGNSVASSSSVVEPARLAAEAVSSTLEEPAAPPAPVQIAPGDAQPEFGVVPSGMDQAADITEVEI